jgi:nucleotide-binding universal stress UspA family protein
VRLLLPHRVPGDLRGREYHYDHARFSRPYRFSADADYALEYAMALASKLQARLTLLHVIAPLVSSSMETVPYIFLQDLEDKITHTMAPYHERVTAAGIPCDYAIVHGVPFQVIIETARTDQIDLVIMGTHGRTGLRHVLSGSVAERVDRLAPCPVLVVRAPVHTPEQAAS